MNLTRHFTLEEFIHSDMARSLKIDNTPPEDMIPTMIITCKGLERIRALVGHPIVITSGYRSPKLNRAVGGTSESQHMFGEAADIVCPDYGPVYKFAKFIQGNAEEIGFDQLIKEQNNFNKEWVHVSFSFKARSEVLTMTKFGLKTGIV